MSRPGDDGDMMELQFARATAAPITGTDVSPAVVRR